MNIYLTLCWVFNVDRGAVSLNYLIYWDQVFILLFKGIYNVSQYYKYHID